MLTGVRLPALRRRVLPSPVLGRAPSQLDGATLRPTVLALSVALACRAIGDEHRRSVARGNACT